MNNVPKLSFIKRSFVDIVFKNHMMAVRTSSLLRAITFSEKLDQVLRNRPQVLAHLLVGCEEQVGIVPFIPAKI